MNNVIPFGIGLLSNGDIVIGGLTDNASLPLMPAANSVLQGSMDAIYARFNSTCNQLLFARYLGGNGHDRANDLAVDSQNNVYLAGNAKSSSGITFTGPSGCFLKNVSADNNDGFIARFTPTNTIDWFTYFGGGGLDEIHSIKVMPGGNIMVSGITASSVRASANPSNAVCAVPGTASDFPDCNAAGTYTQNYGGGNADNFIAEFNSSGVLQWSTYYGSIDKEESAKIVPIPGNPNDFYLIGNTWTKNGALSMGPTGSYVQNYPSPSGVDNWRRGYIARFVNRQPVWHTLLGEGSEVYVNDGVFAPGGNVYVTGKAQTTGFTPSPPCAPAAVSNTVGWPYCYHNGAFGQSGYIGGIYDAFIMGFKNDYSMVWSPLYGGNKMDEGVSIAMDNVNSKLCFIGNTESTSNFPVMNPGTGNYIQNNNNGSTVNNLGLGSSTRDMFIAKFCLTYIPVDVKEITKDKFGDGSVIYPNPSDGNFYIKITLNGNESFAYQIFDISGRLLESGAKENLGKNITFNMVGKYKSGMYLLKLSRGNEQGVYKFIIE